MDELKRSARIVEEEQANKDAQYREILKSQRAYMAKIRPWSMIGEFDYLKTVSH